MISPETNSTGARASVSDILAELLTNAGIGRDHTIHVTGHGGLAALLWFCRHGYQQVGYVGVGRGPSDGGDLLIAPQTCSVDELADILRLGPHPRYGGVLIVQTPDATAGGEDPIHTLLVEAGYRIERCVRGRHRELHVARRMGRAHGRLAA